MKKTEVLKRFAAVTGALCMSLSILTCPAFSLPVQAAASADEVVMPMSDYVAWRYKIESNKLYKRLYNYSTSEWVGSWIFVRYL